MRRKSKKFSRLRELRKSFRMTQEEVARYLDIEQSDYSYIELGKRRLYADQLLTLALMYNVTTDYVLGLSNDPTPSV